MKKKRFKNLCVYTVVFKETGKVFCIKQTLEDAKEEIEGNSQLAIERWMVL